MTRAQLEHIIRASGTISDVEDLIVVGINNENTRPARGWCLEAHDLAIAKFVAGREKDLDFNAALVRHGMVDRNVLEQRLAATQIGSEIRALVHSRIARCFAK